MRKSLFVGLTAVICGTPLARAGELNPPPGPVMPTMKTLSQVEPRIPVQSLAGDASAVYVIDQPGSYYLAGNITGESGKHGISISAEGVTIDLNGFSVLGTPGAAAGVAAFTTLARGVTVRNGSVSGWPDGGVRFSGDDCRVEGVRVTDCGFAGIVLGGAGGVIRDCHATDNGAGIVVNKGARVERCTLRNNGGNQILVQTDGCVLEKNLISVDAGHGSNAAVLVVGATNIVQMNGIVIGEPSLVGIRADGDGNELGENTIRLTASATGAEGIRACGTDNRVRGGRIMVESTGAIALRFDQPLNIIAILIGLRAAADGSTGILAEAPGTIEQGNIHVQAANAIAIDIQGGAGNIGTRICDSRIRVSGAGSTGIHSNATASIIQMSGIVMEPGAGNPIDVLGSAGGHSILDNQIVLAGVGQGGILNGAVDLVKGNDFLVLGDNSTGILQMGGTTGLISENIIRLNAANATGISVPEFVGDLITKNTVIGAGNRFNIGSEGNATAEIIANPGNAFNWPDNLNYEIGP